MDINKLIESGTNIKIEIYPKDLQEFANSIAEASIKSKELQDKKESIDKYLSADRVCMILDISRTTLWQWDRKGTTNPIRMGNLKRYKQSDIMEIGQSKADSKSKS